MTVSITDWDDLDGTLPIAERFNTGIEAAAFYNWIHIDRPEPVIESYRRAGGRLRSMHGPFMDLVPGSLDRLIREATLARFTSGVEIARTLGLVHIVFHSGFIPKTYPIDMWIENSIAFWKEFVKLLPAGIQIHIENVYEDDWQPLAAVVDALDSPQASLCLDVGHVNANSSKSLTSWIGGLGARIRHVHLHNNKGTLDDHFRLSFGTIAMAETLEALLHDAPTANWIVEARKEEREPSLEWLDKEGYLGRASRAI